MTLVPTRATMLMTIVFMCMCIVFTPAASAAVRASLTWDEAVDIDLHTYDANGGYAWYGNLQGIPGGSLSRDNTQGFPTDPLAEEFVEDDPAAGMALSFRVCYFSGDVEGTEPATTATLAVTHPDGSNTSHTVRLTRVNDCQNVTLSPIGRSVQPVANVVGRGNSSVLVDPFTGELDIWMPSSNRSALTITRRYDCPDPLVEPTNVRMVFMSAGVEVASQPATRLDGGSGNVYQATFVEGEMQNGLEIAVKSDCGLDTYSLPIGSLTLIDPSGRITDSTTGLPVVDATVTLHRVPDWVPRQTTEDNLVANTCESPETRPAGAAWTQPAPAGGVPAEPLDPNHVIEPAANPMLTNNDGRYAWDVQGGSCWYVVVTKTGYHTLTSPVVGVFALPVLDLDLQLTPIAPPVVDEDTDTDTGGGGGTGETDDTTAVQPTPPVTPLPTRTVRTHLLLRVSKARRSLVAAGRLLPTTRSNPCRPARANHHPAAFSERQVRRWVDRDRTNHHDARGRIQRDASGHDEARLLPRDVPGFINEQYDLPSLAEPDPYSLIPQGECSRTAQAARGIIVTAVWASSWSTRLRSSVTAVAPLPSSTSAMFLAPVSAVSSVASQAGVSPVTFTSMITPGRSIEPPRTSSPMPV